MIDVNLYCGEYPFRRLPDTRGRGLLALMDEARVTYGVATPFAGVFYKDNLDGLRTAVEAVEMSDRIRFWAVLNPAFPGWERDLDTALELPGVAGIRLFPRYHRYRLLDAPVVALMQRAAERGAPVNIAARLVDDRLHHWLLSVPALDVAEVGGLVKQCPATTVVLSHFYSAEIGALAGVVKAHPAAYVDIGCCKPGVLFWTTVTRQLDVSRLLFGTGAPLYYHAGPWLSLQSSEVEEAAQKQIAHENAAALFGFGTPADGATKR
jgi:uncharacterized protein